MRVCFGGHVDAPIPAVVSLDKSVATLYGDEQTLQVER
jgi:hypothetical protein